MANSTPLDDYLKNPEPGSLSDAQIDAQLEGFDFEDLFNTTAPAKPSSNPATTAPASAAPPESAMDRFSSTFASLAAAQDRSESIDTAVKAAAHSCKMLGGLVSALSRWYDPKTQSSELTAAMGKVLTRVRTDALKVAVAHEVPAEDAPAWLVSQISGQLMDMMISAINRNNGTVLDPKDDSYLAPLLAFANQTKDINLTVTLSSSSDLQLVTALTSASCEVMSEYHAFSYFHSDANHVSQVITDRLSERVVETTLDDMVARFGLSDNERGYLGVSLLRQAGRLMAEAWSRNMAATLDMVKSMPAEIRRETVLDGYPLDQVFADFEEMYQGVELSVTSAMRSLAPNRERTMQGSKNDFAPS